MGFLGTAKTAINCFLHPFNLRLDTCTADRAEIARLACLVQDGHFARPIFPVLEQFHRCDPTPIIDAVKKHAPQFEQFNTESRPDRYSFANDYYTSPDAEILYAMVRLYQPHCIIEVGSGNSTLLMRHAIADGGMPTQIISIDPMPRRNIEWFADEVIRERVEKLDANRIISRLERNDILFIDSSHEIRSGNDVIHLFLNILPSLRKGVIVHMHDIFLPYEYPQEWMVKYRWNWNEQYLLQALLQGSYEYEVLWAGYYLQKTKPNISDNFQFWKGDAARSIWLRRIAG